jgi:hypothetical protein
MRSGLLGLCLLSGLITLTGCFDLGPSPTPTDASATPAPTPADDYTLEGLAQGTCSDGSRWELEVLRDGSILEVEVDVETYSPGDDWDVMVWHGQDVIADVVETTENDADGYLYIELEVLDTPDPDTFAFEAIRVDDGVTCEGSITVL